MMKRRMSFRFHITVKMVAQVKYEGRLTNKLQNGAIPLILS